jgi:hypothetical protein
MMDVSKLDLHQEYGFGQPFRKTLIDVTNYIL